MVTNMGRAQAHIVVAAKMDYKNTQLQQYANEKLELQKKTLQVYEKGKIHAAVEAGGLEDIRQYITP